jgi:hypothetical protein
VSDVVMLVLNLWLIVIVLGALIFIVRDFDRTRREEWVMAAAVLPAMAWAVALAILNLAENVSRLTGIDMSAPLFAGGI